MLAVGLLIILLSVGWGYGRVARARAWAALLQADVRMMSTLAQSESQERVLQETRGMLHQTRADLRGARAEFALPLALAPHLGWVPGYGDDLRAIPILLEMGLQLTEAGDVALGALQSTLKVETDGVGVDEAAPEAVIAGLERARPQVVQAMAMLEEVRQMRPAIPRSQLSPRLAALVDRLDRALPLVENGLRGVMMLPDILGASEPRTYLILVQNEDELRSTGGFISGVARITVDQGRIVRLDFEDSYAVDDFTQAYPLAPRPLREIWGPVPWVFRDSNWSPDFPTAAQVAIALYRLRYENVDVDGVIGLDQQAIQLLVAALEPLDVAAYPEPVTGETVIQAAREAWAPSEEEGLSEAWWQQRKNFMGRVLVTAVRKLQNEPDQVNLAQVGQAVLQALAERHLFVYLPAGEAASPLRETGWDGAIQDAPGDYLMVTDANLGFNKVNSLVSERLTYTVDLRQPERPRATLGLTYRHTGSPTGEPCRHGSRYDLTYEQMMQRCYWDYLRVYAPQGSRLLNASTQPVPGELLLTGNEGLGEVEVLPEEAGKSVFATLFVLGRGEQARTDLSYELPAEVVDHADGAWRYRLYLQKQGGTDTNDVQVKLILPPGAKQVVPSPNPTRREGDRWIYETQLRTDLAFSVRWRE